MSYPGACLRNSVAIGLLPVKISLSHAPKTRFWHLLIGSFFQFNEGHFRHFYICEKAQLVI